MVYNCNGMLISTLDAVHVCIFGVFGCCFLLVLFHICTGWSVIGSGVRCLRYVREILERRRSAREQRRRDEREKIQHMIRNLRQIYREEMTDD